jgi:inosine/xanthosine triphosphate pyrophosphatase family protein
MEYFKSQELDMGINTVTNDEINAAKEKRKTLVNKHEVIYTVDEFEKLVRSGAISDDKGIATLLINGAPSNYSVHIDRHCVTKSDGTLITFWGILKMYDKDQLAIKYKNKEKRARARSIRLKQAYEKA